MDVLIRLEQITKDYGRLRALDNVSLALGAGVIGLLGPNGAGKSTLIKVLMGLVRVNRGSGEVLGHQLRRDVRKIRARVGYMPEDDCYVSGLSGVSMVQFAARLSGLPSVEALRRAHEILDFSGLEEQRYRNVETFSTGMRQKLKFAQAIVHDPPLLILDEPTAGLDPEQREEMLDRVRVLARKMGKTVLVSTHILPDVQSVCDTVVILARGRVRVVDRLETLCRPSAPTYSVRVLGRPESLVERIRREGCQVQVEPDGTLTLTDSDDSVANRVWEWARQAEVGIRSLTPARNSLEQIFLDAVKEEGHADS
jgi:ABC-2 type transport system ATP-binding protein